MSQVKYYILAIFLAVSICSFAIESTDQDSGSPKDKIEDNIEQAQLLFDRGDYYDALIALQTTLKIAKDIDDKESQGLLHIKIGELQYLTGDSENAISSLIKAAEINRDQQRAMNLAVIYNLNGEIYASKGDFKTALDYFDTSKSLFDSRNFSLNSH